MSLAAGSPVGPYEVIALLGEGGMGQVYRARDARLGRDVAIKALPESLASDPERVARFQREAQVLASLNHPNIAGIHGLETVGASKYLVLEFVDGVTLADYLTAHGHPGLPLSEAVPIARQIIDALAAAHDKGIVHRDLKPANIMLTADGQAKVLDFGLARVVESDSAANPANSPTLTAAATQAGVIMGTAAYMSPEQAKGRVADKRSDVWAFGCVLYEMLAGRRVFDGEDVSETLAAVLRADPDWTALPAPVPPAMCTMIRRCLDRDLKTRVPDIAVVRYLLDDAMAAPVASVPASAGGRARPVWFAAAFVAGIAFTALGAWAIAARAPGAPPPSPVRFGITPPIAQRMAPTSSDRQAAMSPDGKFLVYVSGNNSTAGGQLMLRPLDRLEAVPIAGAVFARMPFISPDGKWVGYFGPNDLRKIAIEGGSPVQICQVVSPGRGATWGPDDTIIFATAQPTIGLQSVPSAGGGTPRTLTVPAMGQGEADHFFPSFLPGGRGVLFTIQAAGLQIANSQIAVLDLETGKYSTLIRGGTSPEYVEPGYLVYAAAGGALRVVRFDPVRRQLLGEAVPVVEGVGVATSGAAEFTVSRSGALAYVPEGILASAAGGGSLRTLVWMSRQGKEEPIKGVPPRAYFALRLSPDGTRVALDLRELENDIWVWDLARANLTRLTFDPGPDLFPVWTRDSKRIVFSSARDGSYNLYSQAADGTGTAERLTDSPNIQYATSLSADGTSLVINELTAGKGADVILAPTDRKGPVVPLVQTPANERGADVSPDGRFIAYESDESTKSEVYVRPFPNVNDGKWMISTSGGTKPVWSPTGREIFFVDGNGMLTAVPVQMSPAFAVGNPTKLFEAHNISTLASGRFYDPTRDGQRFVMIKELPPPPGQSAVPTGPTFIVVLNWAEELKARTAK